MQRAAVIAIFCTVTIGMLVAFIAWAFAAVSFVGMYLNRTERATLLRRMVPWWYLKDGMLTERGIEWRRRSLWGGVVFFGSLATMLLIIFIAKLLYGWSTVRL
jgi:hypothetical protein